MPKEVPWLVDGMIQVHFDVREEGGQLITSLLELFSCVYDVSEVFVAICKKVSPWLLA